jgi:trk system potassium uptake protein TrkA
MSTRKKVLIAGAGTMGRAIAKALPDHEITMIDASVDQCDRAAHELNAKVLNGDCRRIYVLNKVEIDKMDVVVAVTNSDEVNLLLAIYAKRLGKQVIVRVKEPEYGQLFEELGIKDIISPEKRAAMDIANKIVWQKTA